MGDRVVANGWGLSQTHHGGFAQKARVSGDWLIKLPDLFLTRDAMAIGTAGYTAMLFVIGLELAGVTLNKGDVLVTGAGGGAGSIAIALLSKLGYQAVASTGRQGEADYLHELGAAEVIDRRTLSEPGVPIAKERWAGAIDSVGSHTLASALAQTRYRGAVAAFGLAQSADLPGSVQPFTLRNVRPNRHRLGQRTTGRATTRMGTPGHRSGSEQARARHPSCRIGRSAWPCRSILQGQARGRTVVVVNA